MWIVYNKKTGRVESRYQQVGWAYRRCRLLNSHYFNQYSVCSQEHYEHLEQTA